jgi:hypothetical protein
MDKGKGLYDNTDFTLVKNTDNPKDTDLKENFGTYWIFKKTFNEDIKKSLNLLNFYNDTIGNNRCIGDFINLPCFFVL